eukprot:g6003.t1 g6003   contig20:599873-600655(-)
MCRFKNMMVLISGILLPIVATLFLTLFASAKTCVETEDNVFFCTDDSKKAKEKARKTWQHYIQYHSVPQTIEGSDEERKKSSDLITRMEKYLKVWVMDADREEDVKERCANKNHMCVFWASIGECVSNPGFMETDCALACQSCDKLEAAKRDEF